MANKIRHALTALVLAVPTVTFANTGVVRGGEHEGFTRLTVSSETGIRHSGVRSQKDGLFSVFLLDPIESLDTSRTFSRLNAGRVKSVFPNSGGIFLQLACICEISVSNYGENLLIIDISEKSRNNRPYPYDFSNLISSKALRSQRAKDLNPNGPVVELFKVDQSVIQRLTRRLTGKINRFEEGLLGDFPNAYKSFENRENEGGDVHVAQPSAKFQKIVDSDCQISKLIWDYIQDVDAPGRGYFNYPIVEKMILPPQPPSVRNYSDDAWIHLVSNGLIKEAMSVPSGINSAKFELGVLTELTPALNAIGENTERTSRVNCNPFASLISFMTSDLEPDEITDEQALELFQTFMKLPLGLQMAVFERMKPLLSNVSSAAVEDHLQQSEREKRLVETETNPEGREWALTDTDADGLGALAKELRDTGFERQSSVAAFEAYLSGGRFFDALAVLEDVAEVSPEDVSPLESRLMIELSENSDTVTFLEVVFGSQEVARANLSTAALDAVMFRLLEEGFAEQVYGLYMEYPQYHSSIDLGIQASRALVLMQEPEEALKILGDVSTEAGMSVRGQAMAMLNDYAQASATLRNNASQDDHLRWSWLGDSLSELVGAESKYAPVARVLTAKPESDEGRVTVSSAEKQLDSSMLIRKELSELILNN